MDWKNQLRYLEQKKDWDAAISFMQKVIDENPNDMSAYININYLLMNLLVEEDYNETKHDYYAALLKHYFTESYTKFAENAEYLFFTSRTAFMSEWYFGIELEDAEKMYQKALALEPENLLYQWAYYGSLDRSVSQNIQIILSYARMILEENSPIKKVLESKGAIGEYLLKIMTAWSERILNESNLK